MEIRNRQDVPVVDTWKLEDMFATNDAWEKQFLDTKQKIQGFSAFAGTLGQSIEALKKALDAETDLSLAVEQLYVYAMMRRDEDNTRSEYQGLADRAMGLAVDMSAASSFMVPEIMDILPATFDQWRNDDQLTVYAHTLDDLARNRSHVLSHAEERLLAMSGEVSAAPQTIYKMLDYADMSFPRIETEEGPIEITHGNFIHLMENDNRAIRKSGFEAFYQTYQKFENTYAASLSSSIKNDVFQSTVRHFPNAMEASLFDDNVPISVYDYLIEAIHGNLDLLHRYTALRKKALNIDELHMYDLYAPLSKAEFSISFDEAKELVLAAVKPMGEEYSRVMNTAFENRWIDVYENRGKSSGAYCWGCYGTHPYVLMNYQNNIDSVFTLAHEMGHAMHSYFSDKHQPFINAQYKILIAEVASTVNESLLIDFLLKNETNREKKLRLINYYLEQFRGTVYRQTMFAEFEKQTHDASQNGEPLTADVLKTMYQALNQKYYGPDMHLDEGIAVEWARISHFYNAFYVYKYATGFSSAVAISRAILQEGTSAVARYMTFLSRGGSDYPLEILKDAGVDLNSVEPVSRALAVFKSTLDEMEGLL